MMFRDPPLVEIPTATSFGRACAISCAKKDDLRSDIVREGRDVGGFERKRNGRNGLITDGGEMQSSAQSFASVADPPLPKRISLPPRLSRSRIAKAASAICSDSSRATCARSFASSSTFILIEAATSSDIARGLLLLLPKKRIKKTGLADVVAQFAMLEKDVHGFPKRVIQDLDHLLMHERIAACGAEA